MSKRVLLLFSTRTYRAEAFLAAAAHLGLEVTVGSDREHALARLNPAGHLALDFNRPEEATDEIVALARKHPLRAVIAAEDEGLQVAAMACAALGLPHSSLPAVRAARNKYAMRRLLAGAGLPSPGFERFPVHEDPAEIAPRAAYPCVLKPLFLSASRGVIRADDPQAFIAAFERIAALLRQPGIAAEGGPLAEQILVEDYIPGFEVAVEGLLTEGDLKVLAVFDKPDPLEGPYFEETIYVTPSRHPPEVQQEVLKATRQAVAALGLVHGPVHAELRVNERGAWPLDIAPRSIGGHCGRVLRFEGGEAQGRISLEELILHQATGRGVGGLGRERRAAGVMMIPIPKGGVLRGVRGVEAAEGVKGVEQVIISIPIGGSVVPPPEGGQYLGFIFARADDPAGVEGALREAHSKITFIIEPAS